MAKELTIEEQRFKVFNNIIELTKNINSEGMIYLTKDKVMTGTFTDERYQGMMYSDCDTSSLYIREGEYYLLNCKEISKTIKEYKIKQIKLSLGSGFILFDKTGEIELDAIVPVNNNCPKLNNFFKEYNKYDRYVDNNIVYEDITEYALESLKSEIPIVINIYGEHAIRFIKKMIRTSYTASNLIEAKCGINKISEHLYILQMKIEKGESTKSKKSIGTITHLYAVVPF